MYLFADDTKIFRTIKSIDDCKLLQNDLDNLQLWSDNWLLQFHPNKCQVLTLGNSKFNFDYSLPDNTSNTRKVLDYVKEAKDLGVIIDTRLSFDAHINNKTNKANSILGIIRRSYTHLDESILMILYKALVRPYLEYANTIWHPYKKKTSPQSKTFRGERLSLYPY